MPQRREDAAELQELVRLLTAENDDLAAGAEDTLVLGLVAERLNAEPDPGEFVTHLLETVCLVKNIAWGAFYGGPAGGPALRTVYTLAPHGREPVLGAPLPPGLVEPGQRMPLVRDHAAAAVLPTGFPAAAVLVAPVPAEDGEDQVLVFAAEDGDGAGPLETFADLAGRVARLLGLRFAQERRRLALEAEREALGQAVAERTSALVSTERRLQAIYDASFDALLVLGADGVIRDANRQICRDLGRRRDDILGCSLESVLAEPYPGLETLLDSACRGRIATVAWRLACGDGRTIEIEARIGPLRLAAEDHILVLGRDVSERNALRTQLDHAQKMELVGNLAGGVAHDFNNILMAMLGQAELLLAAEKDPGRRADLGEILRAGNRGAALTRQLLAFSRRRNVKDETFDLGGVVQEALLMLERLVGENFTLEATVPDQPAWVRGDATRLEQVLLNLVVNARDAMADGGRIRIVLARGDEAGSWRLTVADEGAGIPAALHEQVFEAFYTSKGEGRGTGLGLALVQDAVRQHGGSVAIAHSSPAGTEFEVVLPAAAPPDHPAPGPDGVPAGRGERILVVEDEPGVRRVLGRMLERLGYRVTLADGPRTARDLVRGGAPCDLLVTDVLMPGSPGPALAAALRAEQPDLPVVYVTGFQVESERIALEGDRRAIVLDKPIDLGALGRGVHRLLADA